MLYESYKHQTHSVQELEQKILSFPDIEKTDIVKKIKSINKKVKKQKRWKVVCWIFGIINGSILIFISPVFFAEDGFYFFSEIIEQIIDSFENYNLLEVIVFGSVYLIPLFPLLFFIFSLHRYICIYKAKFKPNDSAEGLTKTQTLRFLYDLIYRYCKAAGKVHIDEELQKNPKPEVKNYYLFPSALGSGLVKTEISSGVNEMHSNNYEITEKNKKKQAKILEERQLQEACLNKIVHLYKMYSA